jgi:Helicase associated domain
MSRRPPPGSDTTSWTQALTALRSYRELRGTADVPRRVRAYGIDLGAWVAQCRTDYWGGHLSADDIRDLESVDGWHWGPDRPGSWRHAFNTLAGYAQTCGTTILVNRIISDGVDLQAWAAAQRTAYINLQLTASQIKSLQRLSDWDWNPDRFRWRQGMLAATRYAQSHGGLGSVQRDTKLNDYPLGQWMRCCRGDYRADTMPADIVAELEALPGWNWGRYQQNWAEGYAALKRYASERGHASPSQNTEFNGYPVGWWVTQKRRQYRHGTLSVKCVQALESLPGWQWAPLDEQWRRGFHALTHYVDTHGHAAPTCGQTVGEYPVGDWVRAQRNAYDKGRLSAERQRELQALPGWIWKLSQ